MEPPIRYDYPPEPIEFHAHSGTCRYCAGIVKMVRDEEQQLKLDECWCLQCGQRYFVELPPGTTIEQFDHAQWREKAETSDGSRRPTTRADSPVARRRR